MEFSVNFSYAAADLLRQGDIQLDRFKCPAWPDLIATVQEIYPMYVHFPLQIGSGVGDAIDAETGHLADWGQVETLLAQTHTPFVNLHLSPRSTDHPDIAADTRRPEHVEMLIERSVRDVQAVVARFGPERVILENTYARNGRLVRSSHFPAFIRRVIEYGGCGLLLDVSHARLAALDLNMNVREYLRELPVERTREIHITGIQRLNGPWIDKAQGAGIDSAIIHALAGQLTDHVPMTEQDWELAAWVMEQITDGLWGRPRMIAFEVGGINGLFEAVVDKGILAEQIPRLYSLVNGHD